MLSRVAERTYWLARYLERAENTARLIRVYSELLLDLPPAAGLDWDVVLQIMGCAESTDQLAVLETERDKVGFLMTSEANPSCLLNSLNHARENARTTRDIVPTEAWREVNKLCLFAREQLPTAVHARRRGSTMKEIIERVQAITGLLAGTMSHGPAYQFIRLGRNLERADMSTRTVDVAAATLMSNREELVRYDSTLWMTVLRCLSGYQMYRQYVRRRVRGPDVIAFLFLDRDFPRAVAHCLNEVAAALENLPRALPASEGLTRCLARLEDYNPAQLDVASLHKFVDEFQFDIAGINDTIAERWFHPREAA